MLEATKNLVYTSRDVAGATERRLATGIGGSNMVAVSDHRHATLSINLGGKDQAVFGRMICNEALGRPFEMQVDVISQLGEIDFLPHLGKPLSVAVYEDDVLMRHFHGFVFSSELKMVSQSGLHIYTLQVKSFLSFLSQNLNMAIFQDKTVPEIISTVLKDAGISSFEFRGLTDSDYQKLEYCVQYQESDFTFISRLMEDEGLYYFFEHADDKHTMVICDKPNTHKLGKPEELKFGVAGADVVKVGAAERGGTAYILESFEAKTNLSGKQTATLRAFDFKKPDSPLQANIDTPQKNPGHVREIYDYHGKFTDESRGKRLAEIRLASHQKDNQAWMGRTQALSLICGNKVRFSNLPSKALNGEYLIVSATHMVGSEQYYAESHVVEEQTVEHGTRLTFYVIPATTVWRSNFSTPRPIVQGLESAIVSGPDGEEIYTDDGGPNGDGKGYGRVKVRFHWDRSGTSGDKSTCWIRVAQFGNLGSIILPRVDQEVMIAFLQGDPDQPIVMGWMINKNHMPVYDLPANKTRAVWRTKRYGDTGQYPNAKDLDTGAPGVNELRFEDKGGSEEVFLHAERDMNTRIRFAESHHVGQDQQVDIGHDRTTDVHGNETTTIDVKETHHVKGDQEVNVDCTRIVTIKADDELDAKQSLTIKVGTKMEVTANTSITLTCGQSSIKLEPGQITIQGTIVTVQGDGQAKLTSPMTTVEGTGMNKVTGGVVMIN